MQELLRDAAAGKIEPALELLDFEEIPRVFEGLRANTITGRVVVKIPQ